MRCIVPAHMLRLPPQQRSNPHTHAGTDNAHPGADPNAGADPHPASHANAAGPRAGKTCGNWAVTESRFREDLQWLADNGYTAISAGELAAGNPLPERAVLITFDDGYRSNYDLAFPILVEYRTKAVISIIGHHLDDGDEWFLTWDQCREMQDSGFIEFGSHTYTQHPADTCIRRKDGETQLQYGARVFADLQKSIDRMETELGGPVIFLAYPNGRYDSWSDDFIKDRFKVTVSTDFGTADISGGLYKLPRFNINMDGPPSKFLPALDGAEAAEG